MSKDQQLIMTVPAKYLFEEKYFQGFSPADTINYEKRMVASCDWTRRGEAEKDPSKKQPIGYAIIVSPQNKKVFTYQRAKGTNYHETRLHGKWSWGIGGHVDIENPIPDNPIRASLTREIDEELHIQGSYQTQLLGYINDDETEVGQVHFGLLFMILLEKPEIKKGLMFPDQAF